MRVRIKEFFTAHYNTYTNRIEGCEEGTLAWHHEKRHHEQFNNKIVKWANYYISLLEYAGIGLAIAMALVGGITTRLEFFAIIGLFYCPNAFFIMLLEIDAWKNSFQK